MKKAWSFMAALAGAVAWVMPAQPAMPQQFIVGRVFSEVVVEWKTNVRPIVVEITVQSNLVKREITGFQGQPITNLTVWQSNVISVTTNTL